MALLLVTVTLSMMTTPLLMKLVDKWLSRQFNGPEEEDENRGSTMINPGHCRGLRAFWSGDWSFADGK